MLLYFEAITQIRKRGLQQLTTQDIVRQTLRDYLRGFDPFSDYLSPEEYEQFRSAQQQHYEGVGMELQRDAAGRIVCMPYAHGPASRAGIVAGDMLEAIDGRAVVGQSLLAVSARIRGEKGTPVRLTIGTKAGEMRDIVIERANIQVHSVHVERHEPLPRIRIHTFTRSTSQELQAILPRFAEAPALILDVRGNAGGALYSAIDAAKLFLLPGQHIVTIQARDTSEVFRKELGTTHFAVPLYLWQDDQTASAAEVFIAALVQNKRAASIGKKTFGKGTVQDVIELADGSALYLTTGVLHTPDGRPYHGNGLAPGYPLENPVAGSEEYLAKVTALRLQHRIERPDMTITITDPQTSSAERQSPRGYLLCFDKDFATRKDAEMWASEVSLPRSEKMTHYQLQRKTPDGISFMACLGIYERKDAAERERQTIAETMQDRVFLKTLEEK